MSEFDQPIQLADLRAVMAVLREGTVTRAAQSLGLSQSALSYQLDRMRKTFNDQLFVRVGNRMAATPFAQHLAEPAARVLQIVDSEISQLGRFDPATTTRTFRLGVNEIGAITLMPKVLKALGELAPRANLAQMQVRPVDMAAKLEDGAMDIAAGHFPELHKGLVRQRLYRRDYICIVSQRHPRIGETLTVRQLCDEQLLESPGSPTTNRWVRSLIERAGQSLRPSMSTQHLSAIPFMVAHTELVAVIPREVFEIFRPIAGIRAARLSRPIPPIDIHQYWHPRVASDPAVRFLRELIFAVAHE